MQNVSFLISELWSTEKFNDELLEAFCQPDYESACENNEIEIKQLDFGYKWVNTEDDTESDVFDTEHEAMQNAVEQNNLDYDYLEPYEYWIVTDWFADKLESKGQMILKDFYGLTIWGRCTTGQAILLDHVIGQIAEDMEILEGMKNEW